MLRYWATFKGFNPVELIKKGQSKASWIGLAATEIAFKIIKLPKRGEGLVWSVKIVSELSGRFFDLNI